MAAPKKPKVRKHGVGRQIEVREKSKSGSLLFYMHVLRMHPRDQYAVLSAVRGPDAYVNSYLLQMKQIITARIRGIVFVDGCPGNYTEDILSETEMKTFIKVCALIVRDALDAPAVSHYMNHLLLAVRATREHPIWGNHAEKIIRKLTVWS
jgi:hypothetical protein